MTAKLTWERFFPPTFEITKITEDEEIQRFRLLSKTESSPCPCCGVESYRRHSYQEREAQDLPVFNKNVILQVVQLKYFCDNPECETEIFTERSDFLQHYCRFTTRCYQYLLKIATHMSCEAAVKLLAYQGIKVSGDTLLNMLKDAGEKYETKAGKIIGIDDWAYRRGERYGTLICDMETHKVIDVLEGRDSETLEKWLQGHPGITIVSRDRASGYASAVSKVLPDAVQIADRFHITKNLLEALKDTIKGYLPEAIEIPNEQTEPHVVAQQSSVRMQPVKKIQRYKSAKNLK